MNTKTQTSGKKNLYSQTNPLETDRKPTNVVKKTGQALKSIGTGIFDQLMGSYPTSEDPQAAAYERFYGRREQQQKLPQRKEFSLFNGLEHKEKVQIKQEIEKLLEEIRQMQKVIKNTDKSILSEVQDVEKVAVTGMTGESSGIYHIRFMEILLTMLQSLREKISESRTWLEAMVSKKKKRGSLFAARAKQKGTQYSLSQELSNARSVQ